MENSRKPGRAWDLDVLTIVYETDFNWAELDCGLMDMLGQGQEPTFLDWTEEGVGGSGRRMVYCIGNAF